MACDFRQGDVAAGGGGAPLSALADGVLFEAAPRPLAILNLGGMANLTLLAADGTPHAFDTGPAGALLDGLARLLLDAPRDEDGRRAAEGSVAPELLAELLAHPFLRRAPPQEHRARHLRRRLGGLGRRARGGARPRAADLLATAVAFVAEAVARGLAQAALPGIERLCVAGGGWHNRALRAALAARTGLAVSSTAELGVDPDAREALVFAVLGARLALALPSTDPAATGARRGRVLGKLVAAPPPPGP